VTSREVIELLGRQAQSPVHGSLGQGSKQAFVNGNINYTN